MLDKNVIEESDSPWVAQVVMVIKKTNCYRVCIYFRKLNAINKTDSYPLPRMDDLLSSSNSNHQKKRWSFMSWLARGYIIFNGVLYRYVSEIESDNLQLVIPVQ